MYCNVSYQDSLADCIDITEGYTSITAETFFNYANY